MDSRVQHTDDTGVSPVVGVILMVAVTVILSAVVGMFVFNLGSAVSDNQQQNVGTKTTVSTGVATTQVVTGTADKLELQVNGVIKDSIANASPGDQLTAVVDSDDTITVVSETNGQRQVISSSDSPDVSTGPIPTEGLIAYYPLNGSVLDAAGSLDGTLNGNPQYVAGKSGQALLFDGEDDYVNTSASAALAQQTFTVSFWMRPRSAGGNSPNGGSTFVVSNGDPGDGGSSNWFFEYWDDNYFEWKSCDPDCTATSTDIPRIEQWYHVTGVFENGTYILYVDGMRLDSGPNNATGDADPLLIGSGLCNGGGCQDGYFNGSVDDVRYYNRTLNTTEIRAIYRGTQ